MNRHKLGAYVAPAHDPSKLADYLRTIGPPIVRILMPGDTDYSTVSKTYDVARDATISIRWWNLDDNGEENKRRKIADPTTAAKNDAAMCLSRWTYMVEEASRKALPFPSISQVAFNALNEPPVWDHELRPNINTYNRVFCEEIASNSDAIPMLGEFSVGTPEDWPPQWDWFQSAFDACYAAGGILALHEYWQPEGPHYAASPDRQDWGALAGRYLHCPYPGHIAITECGVDGRIYNRHQPPDTGYRKFMSEQEYSNQMGEYLEELVKDQRIVGCTPFLTDYQNKEWASFDTLPCKEEFASLLAWMDTQPPPVVITPVPPEPIDGGVPPSSNILIWPLHGRITQRFGENPPDYAIFDLPGHGGLDIAVPSGTPVLSIDEGEVMFVGEDVAYGFYARIWHEALGSHSFFAHLSSYEVTVGEYVAKGQLIGFSGNSGNSTGPHLHFELRAGTRTGYHDVTAGYGKGRYNPEIAYVTTLSDLSPDMEAR